MNSELGLVSSNTSFEQSNIKSIKLIDIQIFFLILMVGGLVFKENYIPSFLVIGFWILLATTLILKIKKIEIKNIIVPLIVSILFLSISLLHNDEITAVFKNLFTFFVASLFIVVYSPKEILNSFIKVITFLAIVSIPFFILYFLVPNAFAPFKIIDSNGHVYKCWIIYVHMDTLKRNCGLFWEPGAFQSFLNLAILFEVSKKKQSLLTLAILSIAVFSTFSTTGYLAYFVIFILYFIKKVFCEKDKNRFLVPIVIVIAIALLLLIFKDLIFTSDQNSVFGKVFTFFEYNEYSGGRSVSTSSSTRYFSIVKVFAEFIKKPLFGIGYKQLYINTNQYIHGNFTCTFVNWLAMYGIVYGGILIFGYLRFSYLLFRKKIILTLLCFLSVFLLTMSENYATYSVFYIFPFLAFTKSSNLSFIHFYGQ